MGKFLSPKNDLVEIIGTEKATHNIARSLKKMGIIIDSIVEATKLSEEEISIL